MIQQAKNDRLTIKVRHAKIMFCGIAGAGKSSFSRLLRRKPHILDHYITPTGETQQVIPKKGTLEGSNWIDLDSNLEIQTLTKILQKHKDADEGISLNDNNNASNDTSGGTTEVKLLAKSNRKTITEQNNHEDQVNLNISDQKACPQQHKPTSSGAGIQPLASSNVPDENVQLQRKVYTPEEMINMPSSKLKENIPETWDSFTLLDTGGQTEFIKLLPAINDFVTITFVVLNMKHFVEYMKDQSSCGDPNKCAYENIELIKCLLSAVRNSYENKSMFLQNSIISNMIIVEDKHPEPVICFIGTHADKLGKDYDNIVNSINEKIRGLEMVMNNFVIWRDHTGMYLQAVDNTTRKEKLECTDSVEKNTFEIVEDIYNKSNHLLKDTTQYEIPISWFILELEIRKLCKIKKTVFMSLNDIKELCDSIMPPHETMDMHMGIIKDAMKFYHMLGTLLYYHDVDALNDIVFTDPQWLFTNLTTIVTCKSNKNFHCSLNSFDNMIKQGVFDINLLEKLDLQLQGIKTESFLELLVHLKIIAPIESNKYFIPTILPTRDDKVNFDENYDKEFGQRVAFKADGQSTDINSLLIVSKSGAIPRGLFTFLVVQLLQSYPNLHCENDQKNNKYYCYADAITFRIKPWWYFTLVDRIFYLELQVRVEGYKKSRHCQIQKMVTSALEVVCEKFNWKCSDYHYGFFCTKCHGSDQRHPSLLTTGVLNISEIDHTVCIKHEIMEVNEKEKIWFEVCIYVLSMLKIILYCFISPL